MPTTTAAPASCLPAREDTVTLVLSRHHAELLHGMLVAALGPSSQPSFESRFRRTVGIVAAEFGLSPESLLSPCRNQDFADARFVVYLLLREQPGVTLMQIARVTGRTHGAIMNGLKRAGTLITVDAVYATKADHCRKLLKQECARL